MNDDRLALMQAYLDRGWRIVPLNPRAKSIEIKDWPERVFSLCDFPAGGNVGLALDTLIDIDLDEPEARALASRFLPLTGMVSGRESKPRSHWWYRSENPEAAERLKDVRRLVDGKWFAPTIVEYRHGAGLQTVIPPSIHASNQAIVWEQDGEPASVDGRVLLAQVRKLAACALLARYWMSGSKHDTALAVGGALLRHGWLVDDAAAFVYAAAWCAGDHDPEKSEQAVRDTAAALASGKPTTGIPALKEIVGEDVTQRFTQWLGIEPESSAPLLLLDAIPADDIEQDWTALLRTIADPVAAGWLPPRLAAWVDYTKRFTSMFPDDWAVMMALAFWSSLWPDVKVQNLNLALWVLGVGKAGAGKNTATNDLRAIAQRCAALTGQSLALYTTGSPEGMWDALAGDGKQMLCYHEEFGGFLKLLQREHMSYAREALCSLYDGRVVTHHRAQKSGVEIYNPHVAVVATINKAELTANTTRQDLTSGYLSRFIICAPNAVNQLEDFPEETDPHRAKLIEQTVYYVGNHRQIRRVEYAETGRKDPDYVVAYRAHLGIGTGEVIDLDKDDEAPFPAGRLFARAKKIAALLALAEDRPTKTDDGQGVIISPKHFRAAVAIVERSRAYGKRMASWIGTSPEVDLSNRILERLVLQPTGLSQRELANSLRARSKDAGEALALLEAEGRIHARRNGKVVRWFAGFPPSDGVVSLDRYRRA